MVEGQSVVGLVVTFILVAVVLLIGTSIMGATSSGFDCKTLSGYDSTKSGAEQYPTGTWAGTCYQLQQQTNSAYSILTVVLIVTAAAGVLFVIRMFG